MICRPLKLRWIMFPSTSKVREIARKILLKSVHYNTIKTTELTTRIDEVNTRSGKIISKVRQARLPSTNLGTTENLQHHRLFIVIMHISQRNILGESWGALELLYTFQQPICCCSYHYVLFFIVCLICLFPLFSSSVFFIKFLINIRSMKGELLVTFKYFPCVFWLITWINHKTTRAREHCWQKFLHEVKND